MNDDVTIDVRGVTKRFRLAGGAGATLKRTVIDFVRRGRPREFTALDDVSFSVGRGETLGLIGSNGAGKSTLLSIIAGTMRPTAGSVATRGVVSSLLELGAGFHPDLTGRENVYLYGAIMNIPRSVMRKRFDDIVDFSGIGPFIDQPVRYYSSGMYVRLGFSVAVQVDPDILLIDEVLAVGDADFQKRCLDKMNEFRRLGKTLLVISHDLGTIRSISDRIACLDHGRVMGIGTPDEQITAYRAAAMRDDRGLKAREWGTGEAKITGLKLVSASGDEIPRPPPGDKNVRVRISYLASRRIDDPVFGFSIQDKDGRLVFGSNTQLAGRHVPYVEGRGDVMLEIDAGNLHPGEYVMSFSIHNADHSVNYHRMENALVVIYDQDGQFDGPVRMPVKWRYN